MSKLCEASASSVWYNNSNRRKRSKRIFLIHCSYFRDGASLLNRNWPCRLSTNTRLRTQRAYLHAAFFQKTANTFTSRSTIRERVGRACLFGTRKSNSFLVYTKYFSTDSDRSVLHNSPSDEAYWASVELEVSFFSGVQTLYLKK